VKSKIGDTLAKEMKAVGVSIVGDDGSGVKFKCRSCGKAWSIKWDGNEEAVRGWWRCPGGCNANVVRASKVDFRRLWGEGQKPRT
jgi:hypothetical protein